MTQPDWQIAVLFGGRSSEHDVSCASALSVLSALQRIGRSAVPIGITRSGRFVLPDHEKVADLLASVPAARTGGPAVSGGNENETALARRLVPTGREVILTWGEESGQIAVVAPDDPTRPLALVDLVFPVLHGPFGEDGTVQGMLEMLGVPYVGSGVLGSAVAMDKVATKRALIAEGLPVVPWRSFTETQWQDRSAAATVPSPQALFDELGPTVFVKPANMGSSVGVSKVTDPIDLETAVHEALRYDDVFIIESEIQSREIECGVLGGRLIETSLPGEILVEGRGFYDYAAKYLLPNVARTIVPADLPERAIAELRRLAELAFRAVNAWGLARVDFFYDAARDAYWVNEVNTLPGFTSISMYAKMWAATGVPYEDLITRLLDLAVERHALLTRRATDPVISKPVELA